MSEENKSKKARSRAIQDGLRLVQARMKFWDDFGNDSAGVVSKLREFGLSGADLLVLDPGIEYPGGQELEPSLRATFSECAGLFDQLKETIRATLIDKRSKRAIIHTIQSYGSAMEKRGALYVQFELRSVDQYASSLNAKKRLKGRGVSVREQRLALIVDWIRENMPHVQSYEELTKKNAREKISKLLDANHRSFGDRKWATEDLKEAFLRYKKSVSKPAIRKSSN
jgi:hypothetical protein